MVWYVNSKMMANALFMINILKFWSAAALCIVLKLLPTALLPTQTRSRNIDSKYISIITNNNNNSNSKDQHSTSIKNDTR